MHLIDSTELGVEFGQTNPFVANRNRGFGTRGPQHDLVLEIRNMPGFYGLAIGTGPGTPKTTEVVAVDRARCLAVSLQELETTIAHELAHACNVWHHGETDYGVSRIRYLNPDGSWGAWLTVPGGGQFTVSVQGGQESGVEECIMRYDNAGLYETAKGDVQWEKANGTLQRGALYAPREPPGTIFCNLKTGTGVNAGGGKAGDASKGKCSTQFCVNDHKH